MDIGIIGVIIGIVINVAVVAFGYGMLTQQAKDISRRVELNEKKIHENRNDIETKLNTRAHDVLPECQDTFRSLSTGIGEIKGKVDMIIMMMGGKKNE